MQKNILPSVALCKICETAVRSFGGAFAQAESSDDLQSKSLRSARPTRTFDSWMSCAQKSLLKFMVISVITEVVSP
jgi:hypothetical protein